MVRSDTSNPQPSDDISDPVTAAAVPLTTAHLSEDDVPSERRPRPNTQAHRRGRGNQTAASCAPLLRTNISRPLQPSMEPSFQTEREQADSYTRNMPPGTDQQSSCIALSFTDRNACYVLSSDHQEQQQSQTAAATTSLLGSPLDPLMIRMSSQDSSSGFYDPMTPYDQCQPTKTADFWPTPPSEPEDFGHVHYHHHHHHEQQPLQQQSPPAEHPAAMAPYARNVLMSTASSPSSQTWAPAAIHTTGFHPADALHIQQPTIDMRTFTPVSSTTSEIKLPFSQTADSKTTFTCGFSAAGFDNSPIEGGAMADQYPSPDLTYGMPPTTTTVVSSGPEAPSRGANKAQLAESSSSSSSSSSSTRLRVGPVRRPTSRRSSSRDGAEPTFSPLKVSPKAAATPFAPTRGGSSSSGAKGSEPYAKLIERALLSRSNYTMTLQEIYQWFEENTDKSKTEGGKGWQNSIRHNLSMNAAFSKKEPKPDEEAVAGRDPKRSTEWVLADWAVKEGVQSTTRYRKTNTSRKAVATRIWGEPYNLDLRLGAAAAVPGPRTGLVHHGYGHEPLRGQGFTMGLAIDVSRPAEMEHQVFSSPASSMYGHGQMSVAAAMDSAFSSSREGADVMVPMPTPSHQDQNAAAAFFHGGWVDAPGPFDHQTVAGDNGNMGYNLHSEYIHGLPYEEQ